MDKARLFGRRNGRTIFILVVALALMAVLLLNRLGSLVGGLSYGEAQTAVTAVGWHGTYHAPAYLPLKLVRSVTYWLFPSHGRTLTRLPNTLFGGLSIIEFFLLIRLWHGQRTAIMTSVLFATSAWVLHVSRLASFDVMYLWTLPTLLLVNAGLARFRKRAWVWYGSLLSLGLIIYIPGSIWLVVAELFFLRKHLVSGWRHFHGFGRRALTVALGLAPWPLLFVDLSRSGQLMSWLGFPSHFDGPKLLIKHFLAVPMHLLVRGPQYPDIWLARSPILDVFTLIVSLIGIYFYTKHLRAGRSQLLLAFLIIGWILVGLGGAPTLSLLVPLLYVAAATGIAYLLHEWLHIFPLNPLARGTCIILVSLLIGLASIYNLRAYFVAWPHNAATHATFHYRP